MQVLRSTERQDLPPFATEQAVLARWSSGGVLSDGFDDRVGRWETLRQEPRRLFDDDGW